MAGASSAGHTGYIAADRPEKKALGGGHVGSPRASRVPHSVAGIAHEETAREQSTARRKVDHSFGAGAGSSPVWRPAGTGCSTANGTPEELRRLARPCVFHIALRRGSYYDFTNVQQKSLGAYASNVITTY